MNVFIGTVSNLQRLLRGLEMCAWRTKKRCTCVI